MKYKLTLMFIFSFIVHITIAGALVYVPYQVSVNRGENSVGEVIWGRIYNGEGGRQKQEVRGKRQEARSKKSEARSSVAEKVSSFQIGITGGKEDSLPFKGSVPSFPPPLTGGGQGEGEPRNSPPLFKGGGGGVFSDDPNVNSGNGNGVLLASSNSGQSSHGEGDDAINAEKGRIYSEQLKGLIGQVKNEIEKSKYYPFLAKLKGIEGTVYVNFHIGQDGKTGSVAIQKSSGSEILDNSALKTIANLKSFRNINPELRELDITVPITYRLKAED